jgi:hypothetical protein
MLYIHLARILQKNCNRKNVQSLKNKRRNKCENKRNVIITEYFDRKLS